MRDARTELFSLIVGRTATAAVEAILAAGWVKPEPRRPKPPVVFDVSEEPVEWVCICDCSCEESVEAAGEVCAACVDGGEADEWAARGYRCYGGYWRYV